MDRLGWGVRRDALVWDGVLRKASTQEGGRSSCYHLRRGGSDSEDNECSAKSEGELSLTGTRLAGFGAQADTQNAEGTWDAANDSGKAYPLEAVGRPSVGGHRREIELIVKHVAGVRGRAFQWTLAE